MIESSNHSHDVTGSNRDGTVKPNNMVRGEKKTK